MKVKLSQLSSTQKFQLLRLQLNRECLERQTQIDALLALFICNQHGLLLGSPGTGKSMLLELLCKATGLNYWSILMSQNTKPEEVFGALSVSALKDAEIYKRNTQGMLPETEIAYLDEVFKANSTILNSLLGIINERKFFNPQETKVPLKSLVGSSNELPEQGSSLDALVDRFTYKSWIGYLAEEKNTLELWKRSLDPTRKSDVTVKLSRSDINFATQQASEIKIPEGILAAILECKKKLRKLAFEVSDRKWLQILKFLKALSWLRGEPNLSLQTIQLFLPDCIWREPDTKEAIVICINNVCESIAKKSQEIADKSKILDRMPKNIDLDYSDSGAIEFYSEQLLDWISKITDLQTEISEHLPVVTDSLYLDLLQNLFQRCKQGIKKAKSQINDLSSKDKILQNQVSDFDSKITSLKQSKKSPDQWALSAEQLATELEETMATLGELFVCNELSEQTHNELDAQIKSYMQEIFFETEQRFN